MKTFEYIRCIYNTLRSAKKGKYDYRDYKWVLLDQDDYNNIAKIFKNAVGREVEYQEGQNDNRNRSFIQTR